jgi:preprotein translocase subunit YajC
MESVLHALFSQTAPQAQQSPGGIMQLLPFILIPLVIYFVLIRPQQKQAKQQQTFIGALKKGDEVVTQSGILGTVYLVEDRTVTLDVGGGTKLRVLKAQVAGPWRAAEPQPATKVEAKK